MKTNYFTKLFLMIGFLFSYCLSNALAKEVEIDPNLTIPVTIVSEDSFKVNSNVYVGNLLLFNKGSIGSISGSNGNIFDSYGNKHLISFSGLVGVDNRKRIGKNGPRVAPLVGAVAATAVAVPVAAFFVVVESFGPSGNVGPLTLAPFIPAAIIGASAFDGGSKNNSIGKSVLAQHILPNTVEVGN